MTTVVLLLALCAAPPCKPLSVPVVFRAAPVPVSEAEIDRMLQTVIDFKGTEDAFTTLTEFVHDHLASNETNGMRKLRGLRCQVNEQAFRGTEGAHDHLSHEDPQAMRKKREYRCPVDDPPFKVMEGPSVAQMSVGRTNAATATTETLLARTLGRIPDADFLIRRGHIEITSKAAIRKELRIGEKEPYPVLLRFMRLEDETLESACEKIAERLGATIVIDPKAKAAAATKVKATFRNVPLDAAVETLAEMAGLKLVRKANVYYLAAPARAASP